MTLEKLISDKRAAVQALRQQLAMAEVELRAYEHAASLVVIAPTPPAPSVQPPRLESPRASTPRQTGHWAALLQEIGQMFPDSFTIDDAVRIAEAGGYPVNRNALRSNLANYVNRGEVERVSQGVFRLTARNESVNVTKADEAPSADAPGPQ